MPGFYDNVFSFNFTETAKDLGIRKVLPMSAYLFITTALKQKKSCVDNITCAETFK